jgi:hypothetical protein
MKLLIALVALMPLSLFAQNFKVLTLESSQIEALESQDGTYARFADIAEGFVKFKGVQAFDNSVLINLNNTNIHSIFLQDGSNTNLNQILGSQAVVTRGGDMGGGGAALIMK